MMSLGPTPLLNLVVRLPEASSMKVYWSWESVPVLADLPPRERRRLWREAWGKVVWRWPVMLVGLVLLPAMLVGCMYLVGYLAFAVDLGWPIALLLLLLVGGVVGNVYGFILTQVGLAYARPYLRAARLAESQSGQAAGPGAPVVWPRD
jgi:hypothetical protein